LAYSQSRRDKSLHSAAQKDARKNPEIEACAATHKRDRIDKEPYGIVKADGVVPTNRINVFLKKWRMSGDALNEGSFIMIKKALNSYGCRVTLMLALMILITSCASDGGSIFARRAPTTLSLSEDSPLPDAAEEEAAEEEIVVEEALVEEEALPEIETVSEAVSEEEVALDTRPESEPVEVVQEKKEDNAAAVIEAPPTPKIARVAEVYPNFADGILAGAQLEELDGNTILASEDLVITKEDYRGEMMKYMNDDEVDESPYGFYVLQHMATDRIIKGQVAKESGSNPGDRDWDQQVQRFIAEITEKARPSEAELLSFYEDHQDLMEGASFEEVKKDLEEFLTLDRQEAVFTDYLIHFGDTVSLRLEKSWTQERVAQFKTNPIDKVLGKGKAVLVDFYADWCGPCKMIKPHIEAIKESYGDQLTVVTVNVDAEPFLAARHKAQNIPLLLFYDAAGNLVTRQEGALRKEDINHELQKIGVSLRS